MQWTRAAAAGTSAALLLVLAACRDGAPDCYEGEYVACPCANGANGLAVCRSGSYPACECTGAVPGLDAASSAPLDPNDASEAGATDGAADVATSPFATECTVAGECSSGLCFDFAKGARCTIACTEDSDCPAESGKCGGMGVCKVNL